MKKLFSILMSVFLIMGCISLPASPAVEKAEAASLWGIDVSEHQGRIDWAKVKAAGVDFAIIRCGFGQDQYSQDDDYWEYNSSECERLGIPYGTYIYSYAKSADAAEGEANHVLRLLKGKNLSYPVYFDMEEKSQAALGKTTLGNIATAFCNKIEAAGYSVGVYANTSWWNNYLTASCFNNWYRWVAQYNSTCQYYGRYEIWQYTDSAYVNGISGKVDANHQYAAVGNTGGTIEEKLETNKSAYAQGEAIYVTASTATSDAWVAIYGADDTISSATSSYYWYWVNGTDTQYGHGGSWIRGQKYNIYDAICSHRVHPNGTMITGSLPAGNYKVAVLYGDYKVLMSKNITIGGSEAPSLEVSKTTFAQGEDIKVKAYSGQSNAWVGLFRGASPVYDTGSYIYYYYTKNYNGTTVSMQSVGEHNTSHQYSSLPPGTYTLTLFGDDSYSYVDATKTITITGDALATDKTTYKPGEAIYVTANETGNDSWVGLYKKGETPGSVTSLYWYYVVSADAGINRSGQTIELTDDYYFNTDRNESLSTGNYTVYLFGDSGYSNIVKSIDITIANEKTVTKVVTEDSTCTKTGTKTTYYSDGTKTVETIAKKEHLYTNKVMTPQTCTTQGYTTYSCVNCSASYKDNYVDATGHYRGKNVADCVDTNCTACGAALAAIASHTKGAEATCKAPQTCTVCGTVLAPKADHKPGDAATCQKAQECEICHVELAPKTSHTPGDEATCTQDQICTVCKDVLVEAKGHKIETGKVCTDAHKCTVCGMEFPEGATAHRPGPAATCESPQQCTVCNTELAEPLGHRWTEATCTEPKKCNRAGCKATEGKANGHTEVIDEAREPGCMQIGFKEGAHCSVCGIITKEQEVIPITGHDWKEATCTNPKTCLNCGETTGARLTHEWDEGKVEEKATCTETGERVHSCKFGCGNTMTTIIPAFGHKPKGIVTEPTCDEEGYTTYVCQNEGCDYSYIGNVVSARHTPGEATCKEPLSCTKCQAVLGPAGKCIPGKAATCTEPQRCTVCKGIVEPATGHKPGAAATCETAQTCTACGEEVAKKTGHKPGAAATCENAQECMVCHKVLTPKLEHTPGKPATCTTPQCCTVCEKELNPSKGHTFGALPTCKTAQTCEECNAVLRPATGHSRITVPEVEATCAAEGFTEGSICKHCGEVFSAQETIPKKSHNYQTFIEPATVSASGAEIEKCIHCGEIHSKNEIAQIASVKLSYSSAEYTGKRKSPSIQIKDSNGKTISADYYTVTKPSGRIKVGKYTYVVKFHGLYTGTKKLTMTIKPVTPTSVTPKAASKTATVKWKKVSAQVSGYQIMVATNSKFTKNKKVLTASYKSTSKKITKLKAKQTYYVKVRTYKTVDGVKFYSGWSKVKKVKTK